MKLKKQRQDGQKNDNHEMRKRWDGTNYRRQRMTGIARSKRSMKKNHHVGDTVAASSAAFDAKRAARESSIFVPVCVRVCESDR